MKDPWFKETGLKFKCTGCGGCCTGGPGYVFLTDTDLELLAKHLSMTPLAFAKKYCRFVSGKYSLLEKKDKSYDCIFLNGKTCSVYESRPVQCRTFPWWIHNIREPQDWKEAAKTCEGINHPEATLVPFEKIEAECLTYLDSLLEQNFSINSDGIVKR